MRDVLSIRLRMRRAAVSAPGALDEGAGVTEGRVTERQARAVSPDDVDRRVASVADVLDPWLAPSAGRRAQHVQR